MSLCVVFLRVAVCPFSTVMSLEWHYAEGDVIGGFPYCKRGTVSFSIYILYTQRKDQVIIASDVALGETL